MEITQILRIPSLPQGTRELRIWWPEVQDWPPEQELLTTKLTLPAGLEGNERLSANGRTRYQFIRGRAPKAPLKLMLKQKVLRREMLAALRPVLGEQALRAAEHQDLTRELGPVRLIPLGLRIQGLAQSIGPAEKNRLALARALFEYVQRHVQVNRTEPGSGRGDALWALDAGFGDSADLTSLWLALARARGLPARFQAGLLLPPYPARGAILGHHAWGAFYLSEVGWIPVDPSLGSKNFGVLSARHILFSTGRDLALQPPPAAGAPLFFAEPVVEGDGAPIPFHLQRLAREF